MGKGDNETAEKILGNCFTAELIISAILTAALFLWNRDFLLAFGASANTVEYGVKYMNIYAVEMCIRDRVCRLAQALWIF